jgi:small nuclear ribonucleoprotein (snRNP)-like protein
MSNNETTTTSPSTAISSSPTITTTTTTSTPPTSSTSSSSSEKILQPSNEVEIQLTSGRTIKGTVFAVDNINNLLFLEIPTNTKDLCDTIVINMATIQKQTLVLSHHKSTTTTTNTNKDDQSFPPSLPPLTPEIAAKREKDAFRLCETRLLNNQGPVTLTREIHDIFVTMNRTYNVTWRGDVMEEAKLGVIIKPPYGVDNVEGKDGNTDAKAISRVKEMLSKLWEKAGRRQ